MNKPSVHVLLVDDEERLLAGLSRALELMGYRVSVRRDAEGALERMEQALPDVVVTDLVMPGMGGLELIRRVKSRWDLLPVLVLTGHGAIDTAVKAMRAGAFDYVTKPFNVDEVDVVIQRAIEHGRLVAENINLKAETGRAATFAGIVGDSPEMRKLYRRMERILETRSHVLIAGESGTGKELIAKAVHYGGALKDGPFITVDCAALSENVLESELFGHAKGSFTGAHRDREGYFEAAHGGTVFLDEIGELNLSSQTRLLRFLQEGEFSRVGETRLRRADARVIAATNRDLEEMVRRGSFREDLYYRLNVIALFAPPLRSRMSDVPALAAHFIDKFIKKRKTRAVEFSPEAMALLMRHSWPGNVRELANVVEETATFADGTFVGPDQLPEKIKSAAGSNEAPPREGRGFLPWPSADTYKEAKREMVTAFDRKYLSDLAALSEGNITRAARMAGMDRGSFQRLMRKYDLKFD